MCCDVNKLGRSKRRDRAKVDHSDIAARLLDKKSDKLPVINRSEPWKTQDNVPLNKLR
jgi:hypothetical protein